MQFKDKLNTLINTVGASASDIARFAEFDRSNISRMRSGKKVPAPNSSTALKLINGIYLYSDSKNDLAGLCSLIGCSPAASADEIRHKTALWLYEEPAASSFRDLSAAKTSGRSKRQQADFQTFAKRLNLAMSISELSNVRLSRLIHADASLISRYRSGVRSPESNRELSENLCIVLLSRIRKFGREQELTKFMGVPAEEIDGDTFFAWMFNREEAPDENLRIAENLLDTFDSFSPLKGPALPPLGELVSPEILDASDTVYFGTEGLRTAVLRFLGNAARLKVPQLFLYSDEDQSWLTADPLFLKKWAALMSTCLTNGTRISIIHNIDRDLEEMNNAIKSWLPLYMSGLIDSFYSKKQRDPRFSHTIFLCPDHFCIEASHAAGTESEGHYHYYTDERSLTVCASGYRALLENTRPLLTAAPLRILESSSDITVIQRSLTLATMPEELVNEFNDPVLTDRWHSENSALISHLKSRKINECIPLADDEELFAGKMAVESFPDTGIHCYTPEQYALHIKNIIRLSEEYPNFCFYPIPETPFPNMKLTISEEAARIVHAARPSLSFGFTHPLLCRAFLEYTETLIKDYRTDRNTLRRRLEGKYL